ncbi:hypothetical protein Tco_1136400 [Tanacetum coccineum]
MKPWVEIIRENVFCQGGHKEYVSACLCHMLYCIETSTPYNLAFFILKRMEKTRFKPKELLPYGMLLTSTQNPPSSSLQIDVIVDDNEVESSQSNSSSPTQNISSSSNVVSGVHQNPPHENHDLNTLLSETISFQIQQRDEHRDGLRSIGQTLKNMMGGKRK